MLIESRTPAELTALLERGYLTDGKRRITLEVREGAPFAKVHLWDDWKKRQSHAYASSLALLLEVTRIDLAGWEWYAD